MTIPPRFRRPLIIVGFVLAIVAFGLAIYFVFFRSTKPAANTNTQNENVNGTAGNLNLSGNRNGNRNATANTNGGLPIAKVAAGGETSVESIIKSGVNFVTQDANGRDIIYYDAVTGQFFRLSPDGKTTVLLSSDKFPQLKNVTWAPNRTKAILEFPDQAKVLYDFAAKKQTTLPKEVSDFSFSPTGDQVAWKFTGSGPDDNWLQVADPTGGSARSIEPLGDNASRVQVAWSPTNQVIALYSKSAGLEQQDILPLGLNNENFETMSVNGRGFRGQWAPGGTGLLFSTFSSATDYNPVLQLASASGGTIGHERLNLGLNTWPDKCAFSTNASAVYCAVPQYLESGTGIYPDLAKNIPDEFFRVDLTTGVKTKIAVPVGADGSRTFSAKNVFVTPGDTALYFSDQVSGQTFSLLLK